MCLTDHASVAGVPAFYEACSKAGLAAIVGSELYVCTEAELPLRPAKGEKIRSYVHLLALARNWDGMLELFALLSAANDPLHFYRRPRNTFEELHATKNLVFTTACMGGVLSRDDYALQVAELARCCGKDRVWLEIQALSAPGQHIINSRAVELSEKLGLGLVAAQDFHYAEPGGHVPHECMINIGTGFTMGDAGRRTYNTNELFVTSAADMLGMFANAHIATGHLHKDHVLRAIANTRVVAEQLDFKWETFTPSLPVMSANPDATLMQLCLDSLRRRGLDRQLPYLERLKYEFGVLQKSGFLSYFLVLHDIVAWARSQEIMIGPGRGSAAGSLVTWLLGITSVDPLVHGLMFERFYRPGRIDLPDIDTDFEDVRRGEVLEYIVNRFGADNVSKVTTFSMLKARGAIKDVARIFNINNVEVNRATVAVTDGKLTDDEVFDQPTIKALFSRHEGLETYARALTGVIRGTGEHASGIIVAGEPISRRGVMVRPKEAGGLPAVCWDMRQAEQQGLMKVDVLGLRTLQVLRRANDNLQAKTGERIDFETLPLDDRRVLQLFSEGKTVSIFQFESGGIRQALKEVGVSKFGDIVAVNALYRPGPMDLIPVYAYGKANPTGVLYAHPCLRPILEPTYGVMIYQEQVMQLAREVAGFDWVMVDKLRKAVGKKLPVEMAKLEEDFVAGCIATSGLDETLARNIWAQIEKFGGYGFNLSHAVCYSVIAYWTAYLKVYHPLEFCAALLSSTDNSDTVRAAVDDVTKDGITILPPDINRSAATLFIPVGHVILSPLNAIKGLGEKAADIIVATREGKMDRNGLTDGELRVTAKGTTTFDPTTASAGHFTSVNNLVSRVYGRVVNKKIVDILSACGAIPDTPADKVRKAELLADTIQTKIEIGAGILPEMVEALYSRISPHLATMAPQVGVDPIPPACGSHPKLMIMLDKPEWQDRDKGELGHGDGFNVLRQVLLNDFGLKRPDLHVTSFYRFYKPPRGYESIDELMTKLMELEVGYLKPPLVLACGAGPVKFFTGEKVGKMHGKMITWQGLSVLCLMSPVQAAIDPDKLPELQQALHENLDNVFN